jgi:hypothetical protein
VQRLYLRLLAVPLQMLAYSGLLEDL